MTTLYTTGCPNCVRLKAMLDAKHIEYTICDDKDTMIKMGMTSAPMLKVDNKLMGFVNSVRWIREQED